MLDTLWMFGWLSVGAMVMVLTVLLTGD